MTCSESVGRLHSPVPTLAHDDAKSVAAKAELSKAAAGRVLDVLTEEIVSGVAK